MERAIVDAFEIAPEGAIVDVGGITAEGRP
jgi:hypothetical protein